MNTGNFRDALGRFATGVTIVTTLDGDGAPIGVTANSYNSVSLDPPLVLWSLARSARSYPAFLRSTAFTIHVLSREQEQIAVRFASRGEDKFAALQWSAGHGGAPVLDGCAAHFECERADIIDGGDHVILIGRVVRYSTQEVPPLVFHRGRFGGVSVSAAGPASGVGGDARFTHDFLYYVLSHAQLLLRDRVALQAQMMGATDVELAIMGMVSMHPGLTVPELRSRLRYDGLSDGETIEGLSEKRWLEQDAGGHLRLSANGRSLFLTLLGHIRGWEDDMFEPADQDMLPELKSLLRRLIDRLSDPTFPHPEKAIVSANP